MSQSAEQPAEEERPRDALYWAQPGTRLNVTDIPNGAINLNIDGRQVVGPLQGFGQLWQKTYRLRLNGVTESPAEVIERWKYHLPEYQPRQNRFFPAIGGIIPGQVVIINATLFGMPVNTGVLVLYADEESFTLMTPEGHPESGWVTFSAASEEGVTMCQVQSMARANDPIYEIGLRLFAAASQENIWKHVLTQLAASYGVQAPVEFTKLCVDRRVQWSQARNVTRNAAIRSAFFALGAPLRALRRKPER